MKIEFIINNKNNRLAQALPGLQSLFEDTYPEQVEFHFTQKAKHAIELARIATEKGCEYLIAVGGDGTLHEVINGVLQSSGEPQTYPVIGLLPHGSANDFARTAGISRSHEALLEMMQTRCIHSIDIGRIVLIQKQETRYFINIAGAGLGAEVAREIEGTSSILGSGFNYFKHIIKGFLRYRKKEIRCTSSEWQWQGKLLQLAVANGRYFGNAICVAPEAHISDGQFQVSIFGDLSIWDYLSNLGKLKRGIRINLPEVRYHTSKEVHLESEAVCGIEADGEYVGLLPATLSILPQAIRFLMPEAGLITK